MRTGRFDPSIETLAIYHNWPGFFAGAAAVTEWLGFGDAVAVAAWTPLALNLLTLASLVFLLGHFTTSRPTVWLAGLLFFVTNWIGQDYFSPQAVAYVLYLTIVGLAMRFYRPISPQRPTIAVHVTMAMLILALVISHQLTPIVLLVALAGLVLWRRTARVTIPLATVVGALALWFSTWARDFVFDNVSDEIGDIDWPLSNAAQTLSKARVAHRRAGTRRARRPGLDRGHRGAGDRRPGRALLAGVQLPSSPRPARRTDDDAGSCVRRRDLVPRRALHVADVLAARRRGITQLGTSDPAGRGKCRRGRRLYVAFGLAYFGKDSFYAFTETELAVVTELLESAPPNSLLVEASRNYPALFLNYERFTYVPIDREDPVTHDRMLADPAEELYEWLTDDRYAASYLLLTESQHRSSEALGDLPPDFVPTVEQALRADDRFVIAFEGPDAVVFVAVEDD